MSDTCCEVRSARDDDADAVAELATGLAWSFPFSMGSFRKNYPALLAAGSSSATAAAASGGR